MSSSFFSEVEALYECSVFMLQVGWQDDVDPDNMTYEVCK